MADGTTQGTIFYTRDGAGWLQCFADDLDAEHGEIVCPCDEGDSWDVLAARVAEHQAAHGCARKDNPNG